MKQGASRGSRRRDRRAAQKQEHRGAQDVATCVTKTIGRGRFHAARASRGPRRRDSLARVWSCIAGLETSRPLDQAGDDAGAGGGVARASRGSRRRDAIRLSDEEREAISLAARASRGPGRRDRRRRLLRLSVARASRGPRRRDYPRRASQGSLRSLVLPKGFRTCARASRGPGRRDLDATFSKESPTLGNGPRGKSIAGLETSRRRRQAIGKGAQVARASRGPGRRRALAVDAAPEQEA